MSISNEMKKFREQIGTTQQRYRTSLFHALLELSDTALENVKKRIPPDNVTTSGMSGHFPGYAATGDLKNSFTVSVDQTGNETLRAYVGLSENAGELERIKAFVHEYGAIIRPRRASHLVFQVQGHWVATKEVHIRAKGYFRAGMDETKGNATEIAGEAIKSRIKS